MKNEFIRFRSPLKFSYSKRLCRSWSSRPGYHYSLERNRGVKKVQYPQTFSWQWALYCWMEPNLNSQEGVKWLLLSIQFHVCSENLWFLPLTTVSHIPMEPLKPNESVLIPINFWAFLNPVLKNIKDIYSSLTLKSELKSPMSPIGPVSSMSSLNFFFSESVQLAQWAF